MKIDFVFANSADPDEMQQYSAFHLGLHTVGQSTRLGVSVLQRVNDKRLMIPFPFCRRTEWGRFLNLMSEQIVGPEPGH